MKFNDDGEFAPLKCTALLCIRYVLHIGCEERGLQLASSALITKHQRTEGKCYLEM